MFLRDPNGPDPFGNGTDDRLGASGTVVGSGEQAHINTHYGGWNITN